jgi:hypothetical protein
MKDILKAIVIMAGFVFLCSGMFALGLGVPGIVIFIAVAVVAF